jgi:hypothetical protein
VAYIIDMISRPSSLWQYRSRSKLSRGEFVCGPLLFASITSCGHGADRFIVSHSTSPPVLITRNFSSSRADGIFARDNFYNFHGNVLILTLIAAWDAWRGRPMRQFALGAMGLVVLECLQDVLYHWGPWKVFATG